MTGSTRTWAGGRIPVPDLLRGAVLAAARSPRVGQLVRGAPVSAAVVRRFVAGDDTAAAVGVARRLVADGLAVSLDHLGEDTTDRAEAGAVVDAYVGLLARLADAGLAAHVEVSVKLTALGLDLDRALALDGAARVVQSARAADTTVTVDMEDHTRTEATLTAVEELRRVEPTVGAVVQAYLRRTESDCRALAGPGSRVRLCKGAYAEPAAVAFEDRAAVDASYARCLEVLMRGEGHPMVATHDPALVALAGRLATETGRGAGGFEFQTLYGVRPAEQLRLSAAGHAVRVYTPYGPDWYGYLMRRLAERPANLVFFARALVSRR